MNRLALSILIVIGGGGYHYYKTSSSKQTVAVEPLYERSYISVYGRARCGNTQYMLRHLNNNNVYYIYNNIDDRNVSNFIHKRMDDAGITASRYTLPVVDVNGNIFINPEPKLVISTYKSSKG